MSLMRGGGKMVDEKNVSSHKKSELYNKEKNKKNFLKKKIVKSGSYKNFYSSGQYQWVTWFFMEIKVLRVENKGFLSNKITKNGKLKVYGNVP